MSQPFFTAELYTGKPGAYVSMQAVVEDCRRILSGELDDRPDSDFYMIGTLER